MSARAEYYQLKGMVGELPPEAQAEVERARSEVVAAAERSEFAMIGFCLAGAELALKDGQP